MKKLVVSSFVLAFTFSVQAQVVSVEDAVQLAIKNNPGLRAAANRAGGQRQMKRAGFDLPKTELVLMRGQYNSYEKGDNNISIVQTIPFSALGSQSSLNRANLAAAELQQTQSENQLTFRVKSVYHQLLYLKAKRKLLLRQDSLLEEFHRSASLRFKTGEGNLLEQTTAEAQRSESKNAIFRVEADIFVLREQLKALLNADELPDTNSDDLMPIMLTIPMDSLVVESNPELALFRQEVEVAEAEKKVASAKFAPDFLIGYFNQTLIGTPMASGEVATKSDRFSGFQVGVSIPLWFVPHQARVKAARYSMAAAQDDYENKRLQVNAGLQQAIREHEKNKLSLEYFRTTGLPNADLMISHSKKAFKEGETKYTEYMLTLRSAISIRERYLQTLSDFNQTVIYLEFLSGNK